MSAQTATPRQLLLIGLGLLAGGLYLALVGFGLLPSPGGRRNLHAPLWIVLLIGLVVLLAGVAMLIQRAGHANDSGDLPPGAPRWMRVASYLIGVTLFAGFALIGSWVALAGDASQFSGGIPFVGHTFNVSLARIMFGFGAVLTWLATVAFAVYGARKFLRGAT
jgi:hypothetical protein